MKKFKEVTDDLQRIWFWGSLVSSVLGAIDYYMEWYFHIVGIICCIIPVILLGGRFFVWINSRRKPKKKPTQPEIVIEETKPMYVSFQDAIKIIADCGYYDFNGLDKMRESMGLTRQSYYRELLKDRIERKEISLYGGKVYSSDGELQKIDGNRLKELYLEDDCNFLSAPFYSQIRENVYTDLSFNKNELNSLMEKLKQEICI